MIESSGIAALLANWRLPHEPAAMQMHRLLSNAIGRNPTDRIYTCLLEEQALAQAGRLDRQLAGAVSGAPCPLLGVPVAVKDNIDLRGVTTSCGSVALARPPAAEDSAIAARLRQAGAILIGKTHLDEAALGASGRNEHFGRCVNPRDRRMLTGGSSSGSAAAVAAGHALLGVGTDTLGSVRIPAALCGIVGFKPTHDGLPMRGVAPLYPRFDTLGLLAGSLADVALAAAALLDPAPAAPARGRLLLLGAEALTAADGPVAQAYRRCVAALGGTPALRLREFPAVDFAEVSRAALWEVAGDFAARLKTGATPLANPGRLGAELRRLLERAASLPASRLQAGRAILIDAAHRMRRGLDDADAILTPTCPVEAVDARDDLPRSIAAFVAPANIAGLPAVSWPQAIAGGRPVNLQLIGRAGEDLRLLALAASIRERLGGSPP